MDHEDLIALAEAKLRLKQLAPDTAKAGGLRHGTASGTLRAALGMTPAKAPSPKQFGSSRGATFPAEFTVR